LSDDEKEAIWIEGYRRFGLLSPTQDLVTRYSEVWRRTRMSLTLELSPEIESELRAQARAKGVSVADHVQDLISRESGVATSLSSPPLTGQQFVDAFDPVRGILTDEEIDSMFARNRMPARPVEL
jgi:hypothetical protein